MQHISTTNEGHLYVLENFENKTQLGQTLQFIEKQNVDGTFVTVQDGTTNEEVIKVLIHRLGCMNKKFPSRQTSLAITKLEESLMWLEHRTKERTERGVEGKPLV